MGKKISIIKAIRLKCLDCMCGQSKEVSLCPSEDCSLWMFRLGKVPSRGGIGNKKAVPPKKPNSSSEKI